MEAGPGLHQWGLAASSQQTLELPHLSQLHGRCPHAEAERGLRTSKESLVHRHAGDAKDASMGSGRQLSADVKAALSVSASL